MIGETKFQVTARLDSGGKPELRVTALTAYGRRTAGVSQDVTDKKLLAELGKLLKDAIKSVQPELQPQAVTAAAEALVYASKRGEDI
jgi:phage tail protein X